MKQLSGRKKKCPECKEWFKPERPFQATCSNIQCAIAHGRKAQEKKKAKKLEKAKQDIKTASEWKQEVQPMFNKMRRLEELLWFKERGIEPYCISCQKPLGNDQWCCGHYKTRKARPDLAFDRLNTFLQHNHRCNQQLSGDIEGYKIGLEKRFGVFEANAILDYCEVERPAPKRTPEDWQSMKKEFRKRIRELEKKL